MPTTIFKNWVQGWTGGLYSSLFQILPYFIILLFIGLIIYILRKVIFKIRYNKTIKLKPVSTNKWFDWDLYHEHRKEKNKISSVGSGVDDIKSINLKLLQYRSKS